MRGEPVSLYKRGRIWWVKFDHKGKRYYLTTGETHRRRAEQKAREIRVEVEKQAGPPGQRRGVRLCVLEALDLARVDQEDLGPARRRTVEGLWRPLLRLMGPGLDVCAMTPGTVREYVATRRQETHNGEKVRGQTIRREVQALARALKIAKRDRVIASLPFDLDDLPRIKSDPKKRAQRGKLWRLEQIEAVLSSLSSKAITAGHLDRCRLIMLTGLRLEELHRLQKSWVVPTMGGPVPALLHIPEECATWGRPRTVPLCLEALDIIDRRVPFVRRKPNKSLALASEKAGLNGVLTPRDLRTFYLSHAVRLSGDPVAVQALGGHTTLATTGLYLKADQDRAVDAGAAVADWISVARKSKNRGQWPGDSGNTARQNGPKGQ